MFFLPALFLTALAIFCILFPLARQPAVEDGDPPRAAVQRRRMTALAALVFIPLFSYGLYSKIGHPNLPDMPLELRRNAGLDDADFSTLISRLEDHLRQDEKDTRGWMLLARSYRSVGRLEDSARAYRASLKIDKNDVQALSGLGEVLSKAGDRVTSEAKTIFEKILQIDKKNPVARYFLSKAKIEGGDRQGGLRDLKALLADTPDGAPWRSVVAKDIETYE